IIVPVRDSLRNDNVVRLNADGSLDETFKSDLSEVGSIWQISLQQDGKILVASQDGNNLQRLNSNGSIDPTFNIGITDYGRINAIALQPDGRIVLGGNFDSFNGVSRNRIARLLNSGEGAIPLAEVFRINAG